MIYHVEGWFEGDIKADSREEAKALLEEEGYEITKANSEEEAKS